MSKTFKLWMLLVLSLSIVSCVENYDNPTPVEYATLQEALAANDLISDIKENPDESAMEKKKKGELFYLSQYSIMPGDGPLAYMIAMQISCDYYRPKCNTAFRSSVLLSSLLSLALY